MAETKSVFIHQLALCESNDVGAGTRIWAFAHVMKNARIGTDCNIGDGAFVESGAVIGNRVTLKNQVLVWDGVTIEDDAFIGPGVIFTNDKLPRSPRMEQAAQRYSAPDQWRVPTIVRRGASLGAGAVIVAGITIGEYALVAAGAVVTRDVAQHQMVVGNPARPMGWVCVCGNRLGDQKICSSCHAKYKVSEKTLQPML